MVLFCFLRFKIENKYIKNRFETKTLNVNDLIKKKIKRIHFFSSNKFQITYIFRRGKQFKKNH